MHILFITENFPPERNASATRVYERACYWIKWGHEVTVITCAPNFPEGKVYPGYKNRWYQVEQMDGIRVVRVKTFISANKGFLLRSLDFVSFMFTSIAAGFFQKKPDIVMATSPQFFAAVSGWVISLFKRQPFIFELGDLWPASITAVGAMKDNLTLRIMEKLELFLYRKSAAIVALTNAFREDLIRRGIDKSKIHVVVNGVDLPRYSPRPKDSDLLEELGLKDKFVIGYIGTHGMAHALVKVLDAAELLTTDDEIRFLFVGSGAEKEKLIVEAKKRGLKNVIFYPAQPKERMPGFLSLLDVALIHLKNSPVFTTVIPSKIFEAMGMGLPVLLVGPEGGEASKIVEKDGAGLCIPSEAPEIFAQTVLELKNNHVLRKRLASASYEAAPKHTRERQAREVINVFKGVITE
ncbi:MAG: glycosyltransferase family 4 protein [Deltaproteobacteria bacterium]|nr:glycosyltransferase family 4 protein [Deltaproteobacteria bacterium]